MSVASGSVPYTYDLGLPFWVKYVCTALLWGYLSHWYWYAEMHRDDNYNVMRDIRYYYQYALYWGVSLLGTSFELTRSLYPVFCISHSLTLSLSSLPSLAPVIGLFMLGAVLKSYKEKTDRKKQERKPLKKPLSKSAQEL
jgi:hypothetical protein